MKKYFNKSLLYQYMYLGKWFLLGSGLVFSLIVYESFNSDINMLKENISQFNHNKFYFGYDSIFFVIVVILIAFQMTISGNNKRNNLIFLRSCPFSNEEIKYNEVLCLVIALLLYSLIYLYFSVIIYFNFRDLLSIASNYWNEILFQFVRIIIVGLVFVLYQSVISILFCNGIFSSTFIILFPCIMFIDISTLINWISLYIKSSKGLSKILFVLESISDFIFCQFTLQDENKIIKIVICIISMIILMIILQIIIKKLIENELINNMNKIFSFNKVQFFTIYYVVISIGIFLLNIVGPTIYYRYNSSAIINCFIIAFVMCLIAVSAYLITLVLDRKLNKMI